MEIITGNIYCSCSGADTLDGVPFAYRPVDSILRNIEETMEITKIIKSVYNFKASTPSFLRPVRIWQHWKVLCFRSVRAL